MKKNTKKENLSKIAIEGSAYNLISTSILKFGGLIFTIILARLLLPELFGVYALVLSIVTVALMFTDLGIENTSVRYISYFLGKNQKNNAREHARYSLKLKVYLVGITVIVLLVISKYLSYSIYKNPLLFYPLLFSCLFIIAESFRSFFTVFFLVRKNMKPIVFFDASIQILKILFSVFALLIFTKESKISGIFIAFFIASFLNLLLMCFVFFRRDKSLLLGNKGKIEKKPVNNYLKFMALAGLALTLFSSIDILMLGKFVSPEYLGYYRVSASLVLTFASLFSLSSIFLPIFTQINKKRFERGVKKTLRYLLMISIPATIGIIFISKYLIFLMYGKEYLPATLSLYFLSLIIISTPLVGLYSTILQSKEKARIVGNVTFIILFFNIILNYIIIRIFYLNPSQTIAGVGFSTMFSRFILLGVLMIISKREFNINLRGIGLKSILFSSFILGIFLLIYNYSVDINIIWGIIEVLGGAGIYLICLILTNGINKEDFKLLKELKKN